MRNPLQSRAVRVGIGCLVALIAACFAILFLNLLAPPRPLAALLPTRTATRRPPPTITPVAYPPTPVLVSRDDFSTHDNFPEASGVKLGYEYSDHSYLLTPPLDPGFVRVLDQNFTNPDYRNLSLHVLAAPAQDSAAVEYGALFWHGEDDEGRERFLAFTVSTVSKVHLFAYEPITSTQTGKNAFQLTDILPPTLAPQIHVSGEPNDIRLDVHPRRLLAYVNGELVLDTDDKIINDWRLRRDWDGRVGIIALTLNEPGAQARFTQFDIYADPKQP